MALRAFPLQTKRFKKCILPYMKVGTCEVMNASPEFYLDSFFVSNSKNRLLFAVQPDKEHAIKANSSIQKAHSGNLLGTFVGAGLLDSSTDRDSSIFISRYLARALSFHTRVPQEVKALKKEFLDDPLLDVMSCALSRHRLMRPGGAFSFSPTSEGSTRCSSPHHRSPGAPPLSIIDGWDMEQYALAADAAFFQHLFQKQRSSSSTSGRGSFFSGMPSSGCGGVWFTASVVPSPFTEELGRMTTNAAEQPASSSLALDVCVSGIGDSRAFGIKNGGWENAFPTATPGVLYSHLYDARRHLIPLSMDHLPAREEELRRIVFAGGAVENGKLILRNGKNGDSQDSPSLRFSLSRSFGYFSCKNNDQRSPMQQIITAVPTTNTWTMGDGDALVLCNHAVFESRMEDTTVDEVAKLVACELKKGHSPEQIAGMVCDYAIRFGATKGLQVTVAVATTDLAECNVSLSSVPEYTESVSPGQLYVEVCRHDEGYARALLRDCTRCGISLSELMWRRWDRVRHMLSLRHSLPLASWYGKECGALQQCMEEEARLFSHPVLDEIGTSEYKKEAVMPIFRSLAKNLIPDKEKMAF